MYTAIFKKEFRQHGILAPAMICLCFLLQIACIEWAQFAQQTVEEGTIFAIALITTVLYAGAAAALAYSTEHADNTFTFLRKLPISWQVLACGKIAWTLCGTLLVLLGTLLLTTLFQEPIQSQRLWLTYGIGIIEAFVWGFFWSTRCRSQVHALLAGYVCAAGTACLIALVFTSEGDTFQAYMNVVPHRLIAAGLVAACALWGTFRWFRYEAKSSFAARLYPSFLTLRYPKKVYSPFTALVHQHLRHVSLLYYFGVICFIAWAVGCIVMFSLPDSRAQSDLTEHWWFGTGFFICLGGGLLFWSTIFGADQRHDSYRFLSRLGISDGKVWWSRMLPALILYVPTSICCALVFFFNVIEWVPGEFMHEILIKLTMTILACWLAPAAVGSFVSISFRSQIVSICLTPVGIFLIYFWSIFFTEWFGCQLYWTTLPLCVALLIASRLRAGYWLRESNTWRGRLIPLLPVFGTMLAVLIALPFVRIYTVPNVTWEQIDAYFDRTKLDVPQAPEKRKALIEYIAKNNAIPPEYAGSYDELNNRLVYHIQSKENVWTYEEYLLLRYLWVRYIFNQPLDERAHLHERFHHYLETLPWEAVRTDRLTRLQLARTLINVGNLQDNEALALEEWGENYDDLPHTMLDNMRSWNLQFLSPHRIVWRKVAACSEVIRKWYAAHNNTLPKSLTELVGTQFTALPVHPFTGKPVEYFYDSPPPEDVDACDVSPVLLKQELENLYSVNLDKEFFKCLDRVTYLRLDNWILFFVGEEENVEIDQND